jgi:hypothetical protein
VKRWQFLLLWLLLGLTAVTSAFAAVTVVVQQHHQNDALHSIICHGETVARTSRFFTPIQRRRTIRFYDQSLAVAHLAPCDH